MLTSCLKSRKYTEIKNPKVVKTKSRRIMLLSNCVVCSNKKSIFIKKWKASGLLTSFGLNVSILSDTSGLNVLF